MTRRFLCLLRGVGVLAGLAGHTPAQAWDPARDAAQPGWVWAEAQQLDAPPARISVRAFRAPAPPVDVARRLAAAAGGRLTRLQWAGPMLLLSGGRGAEHWLAQLQPQAGGTAGLLSRLEPLAALDTGFDPIALAPPGARRMLQVRDRDAADPAMLSSFDCPGDVAQVAAAVRRALLAAGWSAAQAVDTAAPGGAADAVRRDGAVDAPPLPRDWRHPRDGRLSVHLHARPRSTALTFWHHSQEPS